MDTRDRTVRRVGAVRGALVATALAASLAVASVLGLHSSTTSETATTSTDTGTTTTSSDTTDSTSDSTSSSSSDQSGSSLVTDGDSGSSSQAATSGS